MPSALTYPGVYIEEVPSGVRTITGVATSITAFIGAALRGPVDTPVRVQGFPEFERNFGGLWRRSPMTYAVHQFFQNGGADALIVRAARRNDLGSERDLNPASEATGSAGSLNLKAASPGEWGNKLRVRVDDVVPAEVGSEQLFHLTVRDTGTGATERFLNVSVLIENPRFIGKVLEEESRLIRLILPAPLTRPAKTRDAADPATDPIPPGSVVFAGGHDGGALNDAPITDDQVSTGTGLQANKRGIWALEKADLFNLLCIPPYSFDGNIGDETRSAAEKYCGEHRAFYIADPLFEWKEPSHLLADPSNPAKGLSGSDWGLSPSQNAALFFPRLRAPDPLQQGRLAEFAPCGAVAGIMARTDSQRGVWKAPAGIDAALKGVSELSVRLTDGENGQLNPRGVNCLRAFPETGRVVWGARTLRGADSLASEWKYIPVRRLALFIEESLFRGTKWVVFEPNDEPLWAQIRLNIGSFMQNLFRQGAFQGRSPREAYFVKCDRETTTQNDIDLGIVNIIVGFAPLKPAEFVVIKLQQIAGQIEV